MKDEDAKKIGLGILQVLADALGGEVRRDQRQHAAEQRVYREDVEHNASRAEAEQQRRMRAERERDELLRAVDDVQRDSNVPLTGAVQRLVQLAGAIRHSVGPERPRTDGLARLRAERERDDLQMAHETEQRLRRQAEARLAAIAKRELQVNELRARVKDVLDNDGDLLDHARRVRLERAYRWSETPAEGAARLRVE